MMNTHICRLTHTHTHTHPLNGTFSGTNQVSRYQKGKTNLDFTEARDSESQWHPLCKSAPRSSQITTPVPHYSVCTGRMPFLPPNQHSQSTEGRHLARNTSLQISSAKNHRCSPDDEFPDICGPQMPTSMQSSVVVPAHSGT